MPINFIAQALQIDLPLASGRRRIPVVISAANRPVLIGRLGNCVKLWARREGCMGSTSTQQGPQDPRDVEEGPSWELPHK